MAFNATTIDNSRHLLREQDGATHGLNSHVEELGGTPTLVMNAWNFAGSN